MNARAAATMLANHAHEHSPNQLTAADATSLEADIIREIATYRQERAQAAEWLKDMLSRNQIVHEIDRDRARRWVTRLAR